MTKQETLQTLYGENIPFIFDTALPMSWIDQIAEAVAKYRECEKERVYREVSNSVYAYSKAYTTNSEGFVPLTFDAFMVFADYARVTGNFVTYIPTINPKG